MVGTRKTDDTPRSISARIFAKPGAYAFFGAFIAGFFAHLFIFTNIIPNSDGIGKIYDTQQMTVSGRWFLHYASMFNKYVQAPALIGSLSLLFISLAAYLTVDLLSIKNKYASVGVGVLMAVFPAVAYTNAYTFTASAYYFGFMLALLGVWLSVKYKLGFIPGAAALALAIGTYQAYIGAAAVLCLIYLGKELTEKDSKTRDILIGAAKFAGFGVIGAALYYGVLKLMLAVKGLELLSYRGMNGFSLLSLPKQILPAYRDFFGFFFGISDPCSYTTGLLVFLNAVLLAVGAVFVITRIIRSGAYKSPAKLILFLLILALVPLAADLPVMLVAGYNVTLTMRYPLVFVLFIPLIAFDGSEKVFKKGSAIVLSVLLALGTAGSSLFYAQIDNIAYTALATAHRASESFCTRLVSRVESLEGYSPDMPVYIIGTFPKNIYSNDAEIFSLVADYSVPKDTVLELNKHVYYYLNDWLNVGWEKPSEEDMTALADSEVFKAMPLYPADGSVKISDGKVIVKLEESFVPMSDYEIQYENRR
ncbi:MAG: glucosyltransferase domain-containing protein [Clostridia bacterium]|nr:glucosyltransferase domain-containing protein [Clostridia bacterium]